MYYRSPHTIYIFGHGNINNKLVLRANNQLLARGLLSSGFIENTPHLKYSDYYNAEYQSRPNHLTLLLLVVVLILLLIIIIELSGPNCQVFLNKKEQSK